MQIFHGLSLRTPLYIAVASVLLLTSSGTFNRLVAQVADDAPAAVPAPADAAAAAAAPVAAPENAEAKTFGNQIFKRPESTAEWVGVVFYFVLFVFSMVAATVTVERLFNLRLQNILPADFAKRLDELTRRRPASQEQLCSLAESSETPVGRVLKAATLRAGRPWPEVEKGMDDEMSWEMSALRGRHRALMTVGSVAPLVGLLGTVIGMIFAFMVTSQDSDAGRQAAELGRGIYLALLTTAAGLTIAIPCLLFASWFNARVERYIRRMNEVLLTTMNSFLRMERDSQEPAASLAHNALATNDEIRTPVAAK